MAERIPAGDEHTIVRHKRVKNILSFASVPVDFINDQGYGPDDEIKGDPITGPTSTKAEFYLTIVDQGGAFPIVNVRGTPVSGQKIYLRTHPNAPGVDSSGNTLNDIGMITYNVPVVAGKSYFEKTIYRKAGNEDQSTVIKEIRVL